MVKKKVMVVDDEEDFLKLTKMNLESTEKYEVMALRNAKNIIADVHSFKPDLIMLDLLMPRVDGIQICEMLNKDTMGERVPIIVLSALEKEEDKRKAYRRGVVDYIVKPIEKEDLIVKIEKALRFK